MTLRRRPLGPNHVWLAAFARSVACPSGLHARSTFGRDDRTAIRTVTSAGARMDPIIQVDHLVKRYKKSATPAVDDISFDVRPGELFAFLGPNGAGKTTTISILTTTLAKTSGTRPDRRPRPRSRRDRRPAEHRDHLPEPEPRPAPVGRGEHPAARRPLRPVRLPPVLPRDARRVPARGSRSSPTSSASATTSSGRSRRSRAG